MHESDQTMMKEDGWELIKVLHAYVHRGDGSIIWARHRECERHKGGLEYERGIVKGGPRFADHFPRDNAMVGYCCYCGAKCPESFQVLYNLYNWDVIPEWSKYLDEGDA